MQCAWKQFKLHKTTTTVSISQSRMQTKAGKMTATPQAKPYTQLTRLERLDDRRVENKGHEREKDGGLVQSVAVVSRNAKCSKHIDGQQHEQVDLHVMEEPHASVPMPSNSYYLTWCTRESVTFFAPTPPPTPHPPPPGHEPEVTAPSSQLLLTGVFVKSLVFSIMFGARLPCLTPSQRSGPKIFYSPLSYCPLASFLSRFRMIHVLYAIDYLSLYTLTVQ